MAKPEQLTLDRGIEGGLAVEHRANHALVPELGQRSVAGDLPGQGERCLGQLIG